MSHSSFFPQTDARLARTHLHHYYRLYHRCFNLAIDCCNCANGAFCFTIGFGARLSHACGKMFVNTSATPTTHHPTISQELWATAKAGFVHMLLRNLTFSRNLATPQRRAGDEKLEKTRAVKQKGLWLIKVEDVMMCWWQTSVLRNVGALLLSSPSS